MLFNYTDKLSKQDRPLPTSLGVTNQKTQKIIVQKRLSLESRIFVYSDTARWSNRFSWKKISDEFRKVFQFFILFCLAGKPFVYWITEFVSRAKLLEQSITGRSHRRSNDFVCTYRWQRKSFTLLTKFILLTLIKLLIDGLWGGRIAVEGRGRRHK